jgi:hypothetical protein
VALASLPCSSALYLPTDVIIEDDAVAVEGSNVTINVVYYLQQGSSQTNVTSENPVPMSNVTRIAVIGNNSASDALVSIILTIRRISLLQIPIKSVENMHRS